MTYSYQQQQQRRRMRPRRVTHHQPGGRSAAAPRSREELNPRSSLAGPTLAIRATNCAGPRVRGVEVHGTGP